MGANKNASSHRAMFCFYLNCHPYLSLKWNFNQPLLASMFLLRMYWELVNSSYNIYKIYGIKINKIMNFPATKISNFLLKMRLTFCTFNYIYILIQTNRLQNWLINYMLEISFILKVRSYILNIYGLNLGLFIWYYN